jgi:hypothetical protein
MSGSSLVLVPGIPSEMGDFDFGGHLVQRRKILAEDFGVDSSRAWRMCV